MSLLEEIQAEQEEVRDRATEIMNDMIATAKSQVEEHGSCDCRVIALVGGMPEVHILDWNGPEEKARTFTALNDSLEERGASAAVLAFRGEISRGGDDDFLDAIILITRTLSNKQMTAIPYRKTPDGIEWLDPHVSQNFRTDLLQVPQGA